MIGSDLYTSTIQSVASCQIALFAAVAAMERASYGATEAI